MGSRRLADCFYFCYFYFLLLQIPDLWRLYLAGSLHAQLPSDWRGLVESFYSRYCSCFYLGSCS